LNKIARAKRLLVLINYTVFSNFSYSPI